MELKNIDRSISELKRVLSECYGDEVELYLFGSVARKECRWDSDIDILVLMPGKVSTSLEEKVIELAYEIELEYNVVFGIVVYAKTFWKSKQARSMPFHMNVRREALRI